MWYYWSCQPQELLWVGGTYARDPKCFPPCQQETAWIYAKLRPLQKPIELMRIHFSLPWGGPNWPAPKLTWIRKQQVSVEACGVQLYRYMKLHGMLHDGDPNSLWYGYDLPQTWFKRSDLHLPSWRSLSREERKCGMYEHPMAAALDHPKTPATAYGAMCEYPFHLPSAQRLQQMPHAEGAATEHAYMRDEGAESEASDVSDYGTLA